MVVVSINLAIKTLDWHQEEGLYSVFQGLKSCKIFKNQIYKAFLLMV